MDIEKSAEESTINPCTQCLERIGNGGMPKFYPSTESDTVDHVYPAKVLCEQCGHSVSCGTTEESAVREWNIENPAAPKATEEPVQSDDEKLSVAMKSGIWVAGKTTRSCTCIGTCRRREGSRMGDGWHCVLTENNSIITSSASAKSEEKSAVPAQGDGESRLHYHGNVDETVALLAKRSPMGRGQWSVDRMAMGEALGAITLLQAKLAAAQERISELERLTQKLRDAVDELKYHDDAYDRNTNLVAEAETALRTYADAKGEGNGIQQR